MQTTDSLAGQRKTHQATGLRVALQRTPPLKRLLSGKHADLTGRRPPAATSTFHQFHAPPSAWPPAGRAHLAGDQKRLMIVGQLMLVPITPIERSEMDGEWTI